MKPGINTSEFYVAIAAMVLVVLNKVLGLGLDVQEVLALVFGSGAYAVSRGISKAGRGSAGLSKGK